MWQREQSLVPTAWACTQKEGREQNLILYAFLNSPRAFGNVSVQLNPTHMPTSIFVLRNTHTHTHTFLDAPTSQRGLVLCQIENWQTGKSQIILSQLDRDGLNVKMLLGSLRPEFPKVWMTAKTYSTALCYSAMCGRRDSRDVHKGLESSETESRLSLKVLESRVQVRPLVSLTVWLGNYISRQVTAYELYSVIHKHKYSSGPVNAQYSFKKLSPETQKTLYDCFSISCDE